MSSHDIGAQRVETGTLSFPPPTRRQMNQMLAQQRERRASAGSMLENDSNDTSTKNAATAADAKAQAARVQSLKDNTVTREVINSSPDQTALTKQMSDNYLASRGTRPPSIEEEIADQIMLIADGCFANGSIGGMNRDEFQNSLRYAIDKLFTVTGIKELKVEAADKKDQADPETMLETRIPDDPYAD